MPKGISGSRKPKKNVDHQQDNNEKKLGGITGKGFMPGQSGNPKGRPVLHSSISRMVREIGYEVMTSSDGGTAMSRLELVLRRAWIDASAGDKDARRDILERGWGKVPVQIELNAGEQLEKKAEEFGIDWREDPALAAIIAAAKLAEYRNDNHQPVGQA